MCRSWPATKADAGGLGAHRRHGAVRAIRAVAEGPCAPSPTERSVGATSLSGAPPLTETPSAVTADVVVSLERSSCGPAADALAV